MIESFKGEKKMIRDQKDPQNWDDEKVEKELQSWIETYRDLLIQLAKTGKNYVHQYQNGNTREFSPAQMVYENMPFPELDESITFWLAGDKEKAVEAFFKQCEAGLQLFAENEAERRVLR
jgi:dsDNA-binding SOS-regulon protein